MSKNTMLLLAAAVAAYFLFSKKSPAPAPVVAPAAGGATMPGWLAPATSVANDLLKLGTSISSELKGIDGVAPSSLEGHMASLGAYGELGGSFYGSV